MGTVFRTVHLALGSQELWATWDPQTLNVQSGAVPSFSPTVAAQFPCSRAPGIGTFSRFSSDSSCHIYPKLLPVSLTPNCPGRVALLFLSSLGSCFPPDLHSQNFTVTILLTRGTSHQRSLGHIPPQRLRKE